MGYTIRHPEAELARDERDIAANAYHEPIDFVLPAHRRGARWDVPLDTRIADGRRRHRPQRGGDRYDLEARCLAMLRLAR